MKPTEHFTGIRIAGDYQDLNALRDAIFRICGEEWEVPEGYQNAYIYVLSLCYDLRHVYMGTEDFFP